MPIDARGVVSIIREALKGFNSVRVAYLFGSYARGRQCPASDIDIAVLVDSRAVIPDLTADVASRLGVPEEKISIVDLSLVDPALALEIISSGIELINRGVNVSRVLKLGPEVIEVRELEAGSVGLWLRADPIDLEMVREVLARIAEDVGDLGELQSMGFDTVVNSKHLKRAFERVMQTLIESMIDVLRHIISELNLGIATYYRDYVDIAERGSIISRGVAEELRMLIPIRHILVHRYRGLSYPELWREAGRALEVAQRLQVEVKNFLRGRFE